MAIEFNYSQTMNQAKMLEELANDMQNQCCKKMEDICENIEAAWSGQAADAYRMFVSEVRDGMLQKSGYIRSTADYLKTTAKRIQAAEQAAKQAAEKF